MNDTDLKMILSFKDAEIERLRLEKEKMRQEIISLNKTLALTLLKLDMANNEIRLLTNKEDTAKISPIQIKMKI